jgi:hypothetical protein
MSEEIFLGSKNIGHTGNKKIYVTYKNKDHYFRIFQGFGLSEAVIKLLKEKDIELIQIIYDGTKKRTKYLSALRQWEETLNEFTNKEGEQEDPQKVLPVKEMLILNEEELEDGK